MINRTEYKRRYQIVLHKGLSPIFKANVFENAITNKIRTLELENNAENNETLKKLKQIQNDKEKYIGEYESAKHLLKLTFQKVSTLANGHVEKLEKTFLYQLKNLQACITKIEALNSVAEKEISSKELEILSVKDQNNLIRSQLSEQVLQKNLYSTVRPDLQAQALFEKIDLSKNKKEKIKLNASEIEEIKALKKAYKEFQQANKAYIKSLYYKSKDKSNLAKETANKKYQIFLSQYQSCLHLVTRNCSDTEDKENTRYHQAIHENKRLRREICAHAFYNEMTALFNIPGKEADLIHDHGVIIEDMEKHSQSEIKDAIKIATDDQRLNELTQHHELIMLKISTFSHILDNYNLSQNNTFSNAYTKMLAARKAFIEALAKGVSVEERLDSLKDAIYHYIEQLESIEKLLTNNPLSKIKKLAAAKNQNVVDELEKEGLDKMECHIKTAELIEGIELQAHKIDGRAEYFIDKLNEFDQALLQEKAKEAALFIKEKGLFTAIALNEKNMFSTKINLLSNFLDEKNDMTPQQFLKDKLNAFKQAEQKLTFEKAAFEKKYAELVTFFSHKIKKYDEALLKFNLEKTNYDKRSIKLGTNKNYKDAEENLKLAKKQLDICEDRIKKAQAQFELAKENVKATQKSLELANHFIFRVLRLAYFNQVKAAKPKSIDLASPKSERHPQLSEAKPSLPTPVVGKNTVLFHKRKLRGISLFKPAAEAAQRAEDHTPVSSPTIRPNRE